MKTIIDGDGLRHAVSETEYSANGQVTVCGRIFSSVYVPTSTDLPPTCFACLSTARMEEKLARFMRAYNAAYGKWEDL